MKLGRGSYISDPSWLRLGEVMDKSYDVSGDARTRWGVISVGAIEMSCEHRWARKDEINSLWECIVEELRRDSLEVHQKSGVPGFYGLRWEEMWELVSQTHDVMRGNRACVRVCVDPSVRVHHVASSK
jgi:hypothetical protein